MIEKTFAPKRDGIARCLCALLLLLALACDRAVEPFDPDEEPHSPDLSQIFPNEAPKGPGAPGAGIMGGASARGTQPAATGDEAPKTIRGRVVLADALADAGPPGATLFVIARTGPSGPPLAVIRDSSPRFPYEFEIGQANVMIPSLRFEGAIQLSARLDQDGSATSKAPGDIAGAVEGTLSPGATDVVLTLDQRL